MLYGLNLFFTFTSLCKSGELGKTVRNRLLLQPAFCYSQVFPHVGSCPDGEQQANSAGENQVFSFSSVVDSTERQAFRSVVFLCHKQSSETRYKRAEETGKAALSVC